MHKELVTESREDVTFMELEQVWSLRRSEEPENGDRNPGAPQ